MTTLQSAICFDHDIVYQQLNGEALLFNLTNGKTCNLDEVGARMWELLSECDTLEPAYQALLDEYAVEPDQLRLDLIELVDQLAAFGFLTLQPIHPPG